MINNSTSTLKAKIVLLLLVLSVQYTSYAQLGKSLSAGIVFPGASSSKIDIKGKTGFEIGYHMFAKYSERLEWTSGVSYIRTSYELAGYLETHDYFSWTSSTLYTPNTTRKYMNMFNYDYNLSYYVVPDMVAVCGGAVLGLAMSSRNTDMSGNKQLYSNQDLTKYNNTSNDAPTDSYVAESREEGLYPVWNYGFQFGASFTFRDRFKVWGIYNVYANKMFGEDAMSTMMGDPKARFLRIAFTYKFIPSYKSLRF